MNRQGKGEQAARAGAHVFLERANWLVGPQDCLSCCVQCGDADRRNAGAQPLVRQGYLALARSAPERWAVVPADQDPDRVAAQVLQVVCDRLAPGDRPRTTATPTEPPAPPGATSAPRPDRAPPAGPGIERNRHG